MDTEPRNGDRSTVHAEELQPPSSGSGAGDDISLASGCCKRHRETNGVDRIFTTYPFTPVLNDPCPNAHVRQQTGAASYWTVELTSWFRLLTPVDMTWSPT